MKVSRPSSHILIVTNPRISSIWKLVLSIGFYALWYYILLDFGKMKDEVHPFDSIFTRLSAQPFLWIFVLVPVLSLPTTFKTLRRIFVGDEIIIDGTTNTILKNQKRMAGFTEIAHLQIRTIQGGETADFRLTVVLNTGGKIQIHTSSNSSEVIALADDIADIVGVSVVRKE